MPTVRTAVMYVLMLGLGWLVVSATGHAQEACGPLRNHYGPFDYRKDKDKLEIVERAHFTSDVEYLRRKATGDFGWDIGYTLQAFPNHPRALMAIVRLGELHRTNHPRGARYSVECYLERAVRFRPDDATARMLYGIYLTKHGERSAALVQLKAAEESAEGEAVVQYNLGLAYFELGELDESSMHARQAYKLGFPLPGLKNKLREAGRWTDAEPSRNAESGPPEGAAQDQQSTQ